MTKDLDYYLTLNYPIEILQIPESDGGGVSASIPLLGRLTCVGDGETIQEAIDDLSRVKMRVLKELLAKGEKIPEPETDIDTAYSGRILLRLPRELHRRVADKATIKGESINRYIINALEADARARIDDIYGMILELRYKVESLKVQNVWQQQMSTTRSNVAIIWAVRGNSRAISGIQIWGTIGNQEAAQNPEEGTPTNAPQLAAFAMRQIGWPEGSDRWVLEKNG